MVSRLQLLVSMTGRLRYLERSVHEIPALFVRRATGWDRHRVSVMVLPVIPALLLVILALVMTAETPSGRVAIQSASTFGAIETSDAIPSLSPAKATGFRVTYTRRESRAIDVARFLHALNPGLHESDRRRLSALLVRLGEHYQYDPALIVAVIMTESSFDPRSRSHKGALGLMQILPTTGASLAEETQRPWSGEHTLFDPYLNISLGVRYLAKLQKRFGTLDVALAAYNYGPSRIDEMLQRGDAPPMDYTQRVLERYRRFRALDASAAL
jgi:soluble lytic murein transglycosylase